jgi:hypothetical protein
MAIDKIGHRSVSTGRDDASQDAINWLVCQIAIQLRTT